MRPMAEKLGLRPPHRTRFGLHNLRHSLATWLEESGIAPVVVIKMSRWSDAMILQRYLHLDKMAKGAQSEFLKKLLKGVRLQRRVQSNRVCKRRPA